MLRSLLVLLVLTLAWVLLLWFALPVQISAQPIRAILLAHAVPPLVLWGAWRLVGALRKRRQAQALAQAQATAEAERQAALAELQERQAAELAGLRFGCDCRGAVITGLSLDAAILEAAQPLADPPPADADVADDAVDDDSTVPPPQFSPAMAAFAGPVKQALEAIYRSAPATLALPVFVLPPAQVAATEAFELVRCLRTEIAEALERGDIVQEAGVPVRFVPGGDSPSQSVIRIFDEQPDLPGALILVFDSPGQRDDAAFEKALSSEQRAALAAAITERSTWLGEPRAAAVALLVTHPESEAMLAGLRGYIWEDPNMDEALVPFWQRAGKPSGVLAALARFTPEDREALRQWPSLARIHRAAIGKVSPQVRVMEACLAHQTVLEKALLAGGLPRGNRSPDDSGQGAGAPSEEATDVPRPLGWLVHNAGTVARYGPRLGALATALSHFGFDLHPLDEATNFAQQVGDLGAATPWAMLAEAVVRASTLDAPTLVSHYAPGDALALSLAQPAPALETASASASDA